jgi:hypothetical protein
MPEFAPVPPTAPTIVTGSRGPENILDRRVKIDMSDRINTYRPSAYPFSVLTRRLRDTRTADNPKFEWMEDDLYPRQIVLTADSLIADTSLDVAAGDEARIPKYAVLLNTRTREQVYVTNSGSGSLTVTRDIGATGEKNMTAGDTLLYIATVFEDGSLSGIARTTKDVGLYNYTTIQKTSVEFTRRGAKTKLFGGSDPMTERKRAAIEHARSIEYTLFFGQRNKITGSGGHETTFTGGLEYWIKSNIWDVSGTTVSERAFDEVLEEVMRWGDGGNMQGGTATKYLLMSSRWLTELNWFAKGKVEYRPLDETIGFASMEYLSPHGRVRFIHAPILDLDHPGYAFLVDLNHVRYVKFQDDDTHLEKNLEENDRDGSKEQYITDFGLEVNLERSHAIFKGLA